MSKATPDLRRMHQEIRRQSIAKMIADPTGVAAIVSKWFRDLMSSEPLLCHQSIAELMRSCTALKLATTNFDRLHTKAGSSPVAVWQYMTAEAQTQWLDDVDCIFCIGLSSLPATILQEAHRLQIIFINLRPYGGPQELQSIRCDCHSLMQKVALKYSKILSWRSLSGGRAAFSFQLREPSSSLFTLMTYNVHEFMPPEMRAWPPARQKSTMTEISLLVKHVNPDLLLLQEAHLSSPEVLLLERYRFRAHSQKRGLLILSAFPLHNVVSNDWHMAADVVIAEGTVARVANVHLPLGSRNEAALGAVLAKEYHIVAGDFNRPSVLSMSYTDAAARTQPTCWYGTAVDRILTRLPFASLETLRIPAYISDHTPVLARIQST